MSLLTSRDNNIEISVKKFKPKHLQEKNSFKRFITVLAVSLTVVFISSGAVIGTGDSNNTAYAADYDPECPTWPGQNNEYIEFARLGGMTTAQDTFISVAGTDKATYPEPNSSKTFSEQYKEQLLFVKWIPSTEYWSSRGATMYTQINNGKTWGSWSGGVAEGAPRDILHASAAEKKNVIDFLDDNGRCGLKRFTTNSSTVFGNMTLGVAKFLYNIVDIVYVGAMGGAINITEVTSLNQEAEGASTIDEIYQTSEANAGSWTRQIADIIEVALVGDGAGDEGLYGNLYAQLVLPLIFVGAIVIIVYLLRTKAVKALTGFVWMLIAIVLGTLLIQSPMAIPKFIDGIVGTVSNTVATAITATDDSELCSIPDSDTNQADVEARKVSCKIWEETVFESWKIGQFGTDKIPTSEAKNFVQYVYSPQLNPSIYSLASNEAYDKFFTGGDFTANGFLATISLLSIAFFTLSMGLLLLAYQISMLLLVFTAPFFFLSGIVPSATGKGVFLRWFELIVSLLVKRLVITILLAVFLKMFFIISDVQFETNTLLFQSVLFAIVTYIGITQRSKIVELFTGRINFGGDKSITVGGALETVADKTAVVAAGAVAAGTAIAAKTAVKGATGLAAKGVGSGTSAARGEYAKRKLNKMKEAGVSEQERKDYLQDRIDTLGSGFGAQFVDAKGNISLKAWDSQVQVKQEAKKARKAKRSEETKIRKDARKAETIIDRDRQGVEVSETEMAFATESIRRRTEFDARKRTENATRKAARTVANYSTEDARQNVYERQKKKNPDIDEEQFKVLLSQSDNDKGRKKARKAYRKSSTTRRAAHQRAFKNDNLDNK